MWQDKEERGRMIVGVAVILLGIIAFINSAIDDDSLVAWLWIIGLGGAAVVFGWVYSTEREFWAALGAYISGAIAVFVFLITKANLDGVMVPVFVLLLIGVPFVFAWWQDQKEWGLLIPAYVMVAISVGLFLEESAGLTDELIPAYVMFCIGLPFVVAYVVSRNWGLLIPGGILWLIGFVFLVSAADQAEQILGIVLPLIVIGAGVFLLFRREDGGKLKNE